MNKKALVEIYEWHKTIAKELSQPEIPEELPEEIKRKKSNLIRAQKEKHEVFYKIINKIIKQLEEN